jgi:YVTN family beta-propeller protein
MVACHTTTEPVPLVGCRGTPAPAFIQGAHPSNTTTTRIAGFQGRPFGSRVSSGGVVYVTQQDANSVARVRMTDFAASPEIAVGADPGDVVFTHDGRTAFVSNFNDGTVHVIDVATGSRARQLFVAPANAYRLALSPDDSRLYVTSTDGHLYAVDFTGTETTTSVLLGGALQGIALSRDGLALTVSNTQGGIFRLNACTLAVTGSIAPQGGGATQDIALSPDESQLYVANENGYVDIRDATTLANVSRVTTTGIYPFGLAVTPDGAQLYIASPLTGQVMILDRDTRSVVKTMSVGGTPRRIAFDASGTTAVVSNEGNWVDVIR